MIGQLPLSVPASRDMLWISCDSPVWYEARSSECGVLACLLGSPGFLMTAPRREVDELASSGMGRSTQQHTGPTGTGRCSWQKEFCRTAIRAEMA